jgi:hypothetical protein
VVVKANEDEGLLRRVRNEFLEMPGLRLTTAQASRLWAIDPTQASALLTALVASQFLFRTRDGAFMRIEYARPMKGTRLPSAETAVA